MIGRYLTVGLTLLAILFFSGCTTKKIKAKEDIKRTFQNPVWEGADPWMVKHGDEYVYCYSENDGIYLSRSKLMTRLGDKKLIWKSPDNGWNKKCVWAPEIHFYKGRWYVYYAAGIDGPPFVHQRTGVLRSKSEDVFSEYEDMGILNTGDNPDDLSTNVWAIDMTLLDHENKLYAIWSGWKEQVDTDKTEQHLYIQEMENPFTLKGKRVLLSSPQEEWETGGPLNLNEGPEVLKNGDNVFIVYSCRESWLVEYRQGMLKMIDSKGEVLDPNNWEKSGPVIQGNSSVYGVGHVSFVKSPDEKEDWVIYHSKKSQEPGWNRDVRMQRFTWDKNGLPVFGSPVPAGKQIARPSGEVEVEINL